MKRRSGYTLMNQKDFDLIKALINANYGNTKIKKMTDRSISTIQRVEQSVTLEDYRRITTESNQHRKDRKSSNNSENQQTFFDPNTPILNALEGIKDSLERIANYLEPIEISKEIFEKNFTPSTLSQSDSSAKIYKETA